MLEVFGLWMPGWQELLIVAFIVLLLFGARLPKVMKDIGLSIGSFRDGMRESPADDRDNPAT